MLQAKHLQRGDSLRAIHTWDIPQAEAALRFVAMLERGAAVEPVGDAAPLALLGKPEEE